MVRVDPGDKRLEIVDIETVEIDGVLYCLFKYAEDFSIWEMEKL